MRSNCDKCLSKILDGKCSCGLWKEAEEATEYHPYLKAILAYNEECKKHGDWSPLSGDHFSGTCLILFRGDYEKCIKVKEFVKNEG